MGIEKIDLVISFIAKSKEDAKIIHDSLKPDNLASPPIIITSGFSDKKLELKIEGITNLSTANATIIDVLDSYDLSAQILQKIDESF